LAVIAMLEPAVSLGDGFADPKRDRRVRRYRAGLLMMGLSASFMGGGLRVLQRRRPLTTRDAPERRGDRSGVSIKFHSG
jgi:hypothetical protein